MKEEFVLREWCIKITEENKDLLNYWRINVVKMYKTPCEYDYMTRLSAGSAISRGKEITFEQFKQLILNKKNNNMDNRFPFKLNEDQAKRIIKTACSNEWQPKLIKEWSKDLLLHGYVTVSEELYREGRKASNSVQNALLDEIFGKDKEEFKVGDIVITKDYSDNYDGRPLKITRILQQLFCYFEVLDQGYHQDCHSFSIGRILRLATQEEINQALCPYKDGELCFVKSSEGWFLRYATGKVDNSGYPTFYNNQEKSGNACSWRHHKSAKGLNLD